MGLFSRHKKEEKKNDMPPPPSPNPAGGNAGNPSSDTSSQTGGNDASAPAPGSAKSVSAPPTPGRGMFDDIKTEVSSPAGNGNDGNQAQTGQSSADQTANVPATGNSTQQASGNSDQSMDNLFDLSDLSLEDSKKQSGSDANNNDSGKDSSVSSPSASTSLASDPGQSQVQGAHQYRSEDHEHASNQDLTFMHSQHHNGPASKHDESQAYFVTTQQFRSMLEIIDSVKTKVKESSETYLRLMDIKAEEDIEYENLRKEFQFVEDKLYELDSIIFDK